jgi:hypothetical protein
MDEDTKKRLQSLKEQREAYDARIAEIKRMEEERTIKIEREKEQNQQKDLEEALKLLDDVEKEIREFEEFIDPTSIGMKDEEFFEDGHNNHWSISIVPMEKSVLISKHGKSIPGLSTQKIEHWVNEDSDLNSHRVAFLNNFSSGLRRFEKSYTEELEDRYSRRSSSC